MPVADQMKSLANDIGASHETRATSVSDIVKETHQTLGNFHQERIEMARNLRQSLAADRQERREAARNLRHSRAAIRSELASQVQKTKEENTQHFKENAQETAEFLAHAKAERREEFSTLISEIKHVVAAIEKDTDETIASFSNEHKEMADRLRNNLHKTVHTLITDFSVDRKQGRTNWRSPSRG
jgi:ATP-dependent Clp protease ATP-binding subunit ClpA